MYECRHKGMHIICTSISACIRRCLGNHLCTIIHTCILMWRENSATIWRARPAPLGDLLSAIIVRKSIPPGTATHTRVSTNPPNASETSSTTHVLHPVPPSFPTTYVHVPPVPTLPPRITPATTPTTAGPAPPRLITTTAPTATTSLVFHVTSSAPTTAPPPPTTCSRTTTTSTTSTRALPASSRKYNHGYSNCGDGY